MRTSILVALLLPLCLADAPAQHPRSAAPSRPAAAHAQAVRLKAAKPKRAARGSQAARASLVKAMADSAAKARAPQRH